MASSDSSTSQTPDNTADIASYIDSLTPQEEARLDHYYELGLKWGLSPPQSSDEQIRAAIRLVYECGELTPPPDDRIIILDSPAGIVKRGLIAESEYNEVCYGCHEASYLAYYSFFHNETRPDEHGNPQPLVPCPEIVGLVAAAEHCGWFWPFEDRCIVTRKPYVTVNPAGDLHCLTGPAFKWGEIEMYFLNGVEMEEWQVMTPVDALDPARILSVKNTEQRRELIRRVGVERIFDTFEKRQLDQQGNYTLYSVCMDEALETARDVRWLKMRNPSIGVWHIECVPPTVSTVEEALAARAGLDPSKETWQPRELT